MEKHVGVTASQSANSAMLGLSLWVHWIMKVGPRGSNFVFKGKFVFGVLSALNLWRQTVHRLL